MNRSERNFADWLARLTPATVERDRMAHATPIERRMVELQRELHGLEHAKRTRA